MVETFAVGSIAGWRNVLVGAGSAVGLVVVVALTVGKGAALTGCTPSKFSPGWFFWLSARCGTDP